MVMSRHVCLHCDVTDPSAISDRPNLRPISGSYNEFITRPQTSDDYSHKKPYSYHAMHFFNIDILFLQLCFKFFNYLHVKRVKVQILF